jgi:hypothetical protein
MDVVIVYNTIDIARQAAASLTRSRTPENIAPVTVAAVAEAFLNACQYAAQEVFPKLKTGVATHDDKDIALAKMISDETAAWKTILNQWPKNDNTA